MDIQKFYDKAYNWVLAYGPRVLIAIVVFFVGLWLIRILKRWITNALRKKFVHSGLTPFVVSLSVTTLHILLVLLILQIVGIELTLFAALIAAFGVAAGLALSGTLQNVTGGILILLLRPFRQGDNIITQGQEGTVSSIEIFYTVITTFDNRTVIVPNSKLSNEIIVNTSRAGTRRIDIELKFNYGVAFDHIKTIIEKVISENNFLAEPKYRIGVSSLDPDGFKVLINVWTQAHGFNDTRYHLQEKIMSELKSQGIKLPGMV
jgi:small conductance mechanosensitive channel